MLLKMYVFQMVKSEEVLTESTNTNFFLSDVVKEEIQVRMSRLMAKFPFCVN